MKKATVTITIKDNGNGKIEFQCQCQNGQSQVINELAVHIANELPIHVHQSAIGFYNKKGSNNAVH